MKTRHAGKLSTGAACAALTLSGIAGMSLPARAQQDVTERNPDAIDVALTPLSDLNLSRDPIPPVLQKAQANPYANEGYSTCGELHREIGNLDAVLGDDLDTTPPDERRLTPEGVAQKVVGFFIPFRGIIREVSGANEHEYEFREAIAAGLMRRAYLKGLGQAMDCPYPARPAPPELVAQLKVSAEGEEDNEKADAPAQEGTQFASRPAVQQID